MSIEEQLQALEARIEQCIILASGCTDRAEIAANRAEDAAMRAELACQTSQQAEIVAALAADTASTSVVAASNVAEIVQDLKEEIEEGAIEEGEEIEQDAEVIDTSEQQGRSAGTSETGPEVGNMDGSGEDQASEGEQQSAQPIVITVQSAATKQSTVFKQSRTRFHRGRSAGK